MARDWKETCFGEVASFASGKGLHKSEYSSTGRYPVMGSNGLLGMCDRPLYEEPVITIGRVGACGEIHRTTGPAWISDNALVVQGRENCDQTFLYYVLKSTDFSSIIGGTTQPLITQTAVKALPVLLPPLAEQKAIAAVLGALDDKIELNRRMNATLESIARAIFRSWFVDFDPVRANMDRRGQPSPQPSPTGRGSKVLDPALLPSPAGRRAGDEGRFALDPATAAIFPDSFDETAIGHIPHGWEVQTLGEVIELAYGKPLKAEDRKNGPVCVYGANGPVGWHDEKLVSGPGIVVGRKGNPGVVTWAHGNFYPIDTTFYVEPKGECRSLYFLFYALSNHDLANLSADSAVPGLNRNHAYMSKQVIPPVQLLEAFDRQAAPLFAAIDSNETQSRTLAALRDTLLPKLLSGELNVACAL